MIVKPSHPVSPCDSAASLSSLSSDASPKSSAVSGTRPLFPVPHRGGLIRLQEGMRRCDKSTHTKLSVKHLLSMGLAAITIRFSDRITVVGQLINQYLTQTTNHSLFSKNLWETAPNLIEHLVNGKTNIYDRCAYSSIAFSSINIQKGPNNQNAPILSLGWYQSPDVGPYRSCDPLLARGLRLDPKQQRFPYPSSTALCMRGVKKENLPSKVCVVCNRPFTWRKKWESEWDEVTTCSKSCNRKRRAERQKQNQAIKYQDDNDHGDDIKKVIYDDDHGDSDVGDKKGGVENSLSPHDSDYSNNNNNKSADDTSSELDPRLDRKAKKKAFKAARRAQREGRGDPTDGQKQCDVCSKSVNLLIRCTIDESKQWKMVCGRCWNTVSGGVVDGDDAHPYYTYGGLWKNRRA